MQIKISQIIIRDRYRKDHGDIHKLADSIAKLGQLQPIGIDPNYRLIFGERRIMACQLLGWEAVEGSIIHLENMLEGEYAENEYSKNWTVSERVAILAAIETLGQGARTDKQPRPNLDNVGEAAKKVGLKRSTAYNAKAVVDQGVPELIEKMDASELHVRFNPFELAQ